MRKIALTALVIVAGTVAAYSQTEQNLPTEIYVEGAKNHVQGIAYDKAVGSMYFSFTTSFIKTDMEREGTRLHRQDSGTSWGDDVQSLGQKGLCLFGMQG